MDYNWCQVPWCYAPLAAQQELKGSVLYKLYIMMPEVVSDWFHFAQTHPTALARKGLFDLC